MKYYISIDNGVTGSICVVNERGDLELYEPTPVVKCLNYTKARAYINRVSGVALRALLEPYSKDCTLVIERPMVNPLRWKASVSAIRCDEATLVILEELKIRYRYVDSKEWQKDMLPKRTPVPKAVKGATQEEKKALKAKRAAFAAETKSLSLAVGKRLFPGLKISKDADAICMSEWARKNKL